MLRLLWDVCGNCQGNWRYLLQYCQPWTIITCTGAHRHTSHLQHYPEALCIDWEEQQAISNSSYRELRIKNRHFKQSEGEIVEKNPQMCMCGIKMWCREIWKSWKKKGVQQCKAQSCLLTVCQGVTTLSCIQLRVISWPCPTGWAIGGNQATQGPISGMR